MQPNAGRALKRANIAKVTRNGHAKLTGQQ
jgi:hypothetical protein